ncbi:hypothetical protein Q9K02_04250 [Qipengyuania sp. G39]|uniref:Uncharacterized protein n=1 Tax=Qipengyuania profundimaris TaxID=3067652 RepID=A0ABT9HMH6_9SPHN|nr:hypothetical protein [Qipengyuania sp. G39]MDP4574348.1 hypothetical protein [Qipengyuania sp. G39]
MPVYQVLLEGHDFPGELMDDQSGKYGFFTTRFVRATSPTDAEFKAKKLVRAEFDWAFSCVGTPWGRPSLTIDEITEIETMPESRGGGASWFSEDEA